MFVRVLESTAIPGANEREPEPANSSTGIGVEYLVPAVRTSVFTMKRLLRVPPDVSGLVNVTAPAPENPLKTASRKLVYVFSSPAASGISAVRFVPVASYNVAVTENADDVGLKSATYDWKAPPMPDTFATTGTV